MEKLTELWAKIPLPIKIVLGVVVLAVIFNAVV